MTPEEFEEVLDIVVGRLAEDAVSNKRRADSSREFEEHVLDALRDALADRGANADPSFHPHAFPDIKVNGFGVEAKITKKNRWQANANSVFEGMRDSDVTAVYVVFGKMGSWPEVRWARYEDCITHVRITHAPRFTIDMENPARIFETMGIEYREFARLSDEEKMRHVREYARGRLKPGQRLWWLEDQGEDDHSWPLEVRMYMDLEQAEKDVLRAEAALLCPRVVAPRGTKHKYVDAALYLLRRHGVFCPQARDLYSAGSVALRDNPERGGHYLSRAFRSIERQMRTAAKELPDELIVEYWGKSCPPDERISEWLRQADELAGDWTPSEEMFTSDDDD